MLVFAIPYRTIAQLLSCSPLERKPARVGFMLYFGLWSAVAVTSKGYIGRRAYRRRHLVLMTQSDTGESSGLPIPP
jgi:hypothetical protein